MNYLPAIPAILHTPFSSLGFAHAPYRMKYFVTYVLASLHTCGVFDFLDFDTSHLTSFLRFKKHLYKEYDDWLQDEERHTFTKGGKIRAPTKTDLCDMMVRSWDKISEEGIIKSFGVWTSRS